MEAATVTAEIRYMGAYLGVGTCPRHYGIAKKNCSELNLAVWQSIFAAVKLKSANIFAMVIWGPITKFYSHQYFQLIVWYDKLCYCYCQGLLHFLCINQIGCIASSPCRPLHVHFQCYIKMMHGSGMGTRLIIDGHT